MRATATVLAIDSVHNIAVWGHVGDTRLYCFRDGAIVAQTKDHSVVQKMVDAGYLAQTAMRKSLQSAASCSRRSATTRISRRRSSASPFPIRARRRLPAVHRRLLGIRRRDGDGGGAVARAARPPTGCGRWCDDVVRRGGREQDNFSALAVFCTATPGAARTPTRRKLYQTDDPCAIFAFAGRARDGYHSGQDRRFSWHMT